MDRREFLAALGAAAAAAGLGVATPEVVEDPPAASPDSVQEPVWMYRTDLHRAGTLHEARVLMQRKVEDAKRRCEIVAEQYGRSIARWEVTSMADGSCLGLHGQLCHVVARFA